MLNLRRTVAAGALLAGLALPGMALAAPGYTTGTVNMRTGPGVNFERITTLPAGARVDVRGCSSWCAVSYRGMAGYVSKNYIQTRFAMQPRFQRPAAPRFGYHQRPWWDDQHQAWYDGNRWYYGGRWYDRPSGFSFGFKFGG